MKKVTISEEETIAFAEGLAKELDAGYLVLLSGELGAGKTRFAKGIAKGLEVKEAVTSPTFTIVNEYEGRIPVYHIDLYRLESFPLEDISLEEMLEEGVVMVEWWEKDKDLFLSIKPRVEVYLKVLSESKREIELKWCR